MPAETDPPPPPPFEITPEMQAQLAALQQQAMAQLQALVAALEAAAKQLALPPPEPGPEKIIPITPEPPPEIFTGGVDPAVLWLDPPGLVIDPADKGGGGDWFRPVPLAVELARAVPVELPVVAVELPAAVDPGGAAPVDVVDLSGFWLALDRHHGGAEGGMF